MQVLHVGRGHRPEFGPPKRHLALPDNVTGKWGLGRPPANLPPATLPAEHPEFTADRSPCPDRQRWCISSVENSSQGRLQANGAAAAVQTPRLCRARRRARRSSQLSPAVLRELLNQLLPVFISISSFCFVIWLLSVSTSKQHQHPGLPAMPCLGSPGQLPLLPACLPACLPT